jgi:hypothetical protein
MSKEDKRLIVDFFNNGCECRNHYSIYHQEYFHYPNYETGVGFKAGNHKNYCIMESDYVEITLEQFKKYVLQRNEESSTINNYELF